MTHEEPTEAEAIDALHGLAIVAAGAFIRKRGDPMPSDEQIEAISEEARRRVLDLIARTRDEAVDRVEVVRRVSACGVAAAMHVRGVFPRNQLN